MTELQALSVSTSTWNAPVAASARGTEDLPELEGFIIDCQPMEPIVALRGHPYHMYRDKCPSMLHVIDGTNIPFSKIFQVDSVTNNAQPPGYTYLRDQEI